ncbi:unnamed protein product, partial [Polarella glacialis]
MGATCCHGPLFSDQFEEAQLNRCRSAAENAKGTVQQPKAHRSCAACYACVSTESTRKMNAFQAPEHGYGMDVDATHWNHQSPQNPVELQQVQLRLQQMQQLQLQQ